MGLIVIGLLLVIIYLLWTFVSEFKKLVKDFGDGTSAITVSTRNNFQPVPMEDENGGY